MSVHLNYVTVALILIIQEVIGIKMLIPKTPVNSKNFVYDIQ